MHSTVKIFVLKVFSSKWILNIFVAISKIENEPLYSVYSLNSGRPFLQEIEKEVQCNIDEIMFLLSYQCPIFCNINVLYQYFIKIVKAYFVLHEKEKGWFLYYCISLNDDDMFWNKENVRNTICTWTRFPPFAW